MSPNIDSSVYIAEGAIVVGDVTIGKDCNIWHNAVLRGDIGPIVVGEGTSIQDNCVLHCGPGFPISVGNGVTIGHGAIVHGCTVGDNSMIGMGATVLNGAKIGKNCIVGAGALVTQGTEIPDGSIAFGNPAKIRREATEKDIEGNRLNAEGYVEMGRKAKLAQEG